MINLVKLTKDNQSLGYFIKLKGGFKEVEIVDKLTKIKDAEMIPVSIDFHTGEIKEETSLVSYIN